jgi:hypothetical protein
MVMLGRRWDSRHEAESSLVGEGFSGRPADAATEDTTDADLARARAGDDAAFTRLVEPLRRELHAHCYRMLGCAHDADDALQDALLLFEVLGFSAAEIATMMATSTTSVNSALARARKTVAEKVPSRTNQQMLRQIGDARIREIVTRYATALERGDTDALVALLTEDVTWSMPPLPHWYHGIEAVTDFAVRVPLTRCPSWRYLPASGNGQPAVAFYVGNNDSRPHSAWSIKVLTLRGEHIADITSFLGSDHFASFGLPAALP